jgi:tetratricopeptide (TPR) repeat protein
VSAVASASKNGELFQSLFDKGIKLMEGIIRLDGRPSQHLGFFAKRRLRKAGVIFEKALQVDSANAAVMLFLSKIEERLQRFEKSLEWIKRANTAEPDHFVLIIELGAAFGRLGRHVEAISVLAPAAHANPDEVRIHCNLALSFLMAGEAENAVRVFEHVIRLEPDVAVNRKLLALAQDVASGAKPVPRSEADIAAMI